MADDFDGSIKLGVTLNPADVRKTAQQLKNEIADIFKASSGQEITNELQKIQVQMDKSVSSAEKITAKMNELANVKLPTEEFKEVDAQLDDMLTKLDSQAKVMQEYEANFRHIPDSEQAKFDAIAQQVDLLEQRRQALIDSGKAFINGKETEKYKELSNQLNAVNNQMLINIRRYQQQQEASQQAGNESVRQVHRTRQAVSTTTDFVNNSHLSIKKLTRTILKYGLGIRSTYILFRKLKAAAKEGLTNLAKYSSDVNDTMSIWTTNIQYIKNSLGAVIEPIANIVMPIFDAIGDKIAFVSQKFAEFVAYLSGRDYVYKAVKVQKKFADSLNDTANASENALGSYDKLQVISKESTSGSDSDASQMFEKVEGFDTAWIQNLMTPFEKLGAVFTKFVGPVKEWVVDTGLPAIVDGFRRLAEDINWDIILQALGRCGEIFADFTIGIGEGLIWLFERLVDLLTMVPEDVWLVVLPSIFTSILMFKSAMIVGSILTGIATGFKVLLAALTGHPLIAIAAGITALAVAIVSLSDTSDEWNAKSPSSWIGTYSKDLDALTKSGENFTASYRNLSRTMQENIGVSNFEFDYIRQMADEYIRLSQNFDTLSTTDKEKLKGYATYLQSKVPEIGANIDAITGKWLGTQQQIDDCIDSAQKLALQTAIANANAQLTDIMIKAKYEQQKYGKTIDETISKMNEKYKDLGNTLGIPIEKVTQSIRENGYILGENSEVTKEQWRAYTKLADATDSESRALYRDIQALMNVKKTQTEYNYTIADAQEQLEYYNSLTLVNGQIVSETSESNKKAITEDVAAVTDGTSKEINELKRVAESGANAAESASNKINTALDTIETERTVNINTSNATSALQTLGNHFGSSIISAYTAVKDKLKGSSWGNAPGISSFIAIMDKIIPTLNFPAGANGMVLPANNPFLALVGDQKSGMNIETPLSTMLEAFNAALDSRQNVSNNQPIVLQLNGRTLAEAVWDEDEKRYKQRGGRY